MTERNPAGAHQTKIAKATLRMSDIGASIMCGMTKEQAREHLRRMGWSQAKIDAWEASS